MMITAAFILDMFIRFAVYWSVIFVVSFTVWMSVDAAKQDRFWWIVMILGIPFIGPAVYYVTEKKHEYKKAENHHVHVSETESQHEQAPKEHEHHEVKIDVVSQVAREEKTVELEVKEVDKHEHAPKEHATHEKKEHHEVKS